MSLPTAVASGIDARPDDAFVPVRPVRAGIVAGVLAALYLVVVYLAQPVPDRFVRLVGGQGGELGRTGGVRISWQAPTTQAFTQTALVLAQHGTHVTPLEGNTLVIDIPSVARDDVQELIDAMTGAQLQFREVLESDAMKSLVHTLGLPMKQQWPLDADIDQWRPEDGGATHVDYFLRARTRQELEQALAKARGLGWTLPSGAQVGYEYVVGPGEPSVDYWRTYLLASEVGLDGGDIANAMGSYDPNTNRPIVMVDMTREGARKFAELTARVAGKKLAIVTGDLVKSAPVINGAIRGGRAQITMGSSDPQKQEHERDLLVKVLRAGALPPGGAVTSQHILPPTDTPLRLWLARLVLALGGGALVGLFAWIVVRVTRPVQRRAPAAQPGPWPASRVLVTVFVPVAAVLGLSYLPVPALDYEAFGRVMGPSAINVMNLGALGIAPLVAAYLLSELLAVTVWRKRRHAGPEARRPIRDAFVVLAIVLTALQAWMVATYLQSITFEDLIPQTSQARLEVVAAFGLAAAALAGVAALIRSAGLGNGYGALIATGWFILAVRGGAHIPTTAMLVLLVQVLAIAIPVALVLRWRVYGAGEAMLRVPTSGVLPVSQASGVMFLLAALVWMDLGIFTSKLFEVVELTRGRAALGYLIGAVLVVVWSAAFAWPAAIPAERAGLKRPSWTSWARATAVSLALLAAIVAVLAPGTKSPTLVNPVMIAIVTAVLLDAYDDMRARRVILDRVWTVHSAQRAELVERQLRDAGIPCHLTGAHVRTILGGFGAFAPIDVLVPTEHAPAAQTLLGSS